MIAAATAILGILAQPSADPVLLDGRCDPAEYAKAESRDLELGVVFHAMHDEQFITLCAALPPDSLGTMDLYLQPESGGPITNLHISAQVGERTYQDGENPDWTWGNHRGWYGPPVAFTGATVRPDGTARATFADATGREIRLSKSRFGQGPWKMRIELRAVGPAKANTVRIPTNEGEWTALRLRPAESGEPKRIVYYLHGKIVEDLGPRGVSPRFGAYDYPGIIDALRNSGLEVISEVRSKDTDPSAYADQLIADINGRIASGTKAESITVIGASKGALIATHVSARLKNPGVRYVLLANCSDWMRRELKPQLTGNILSIYESTDELAGSCRPLIEKSSKVTTFEEIRLETGLGHGMLYRPLPEWVGPATEWARR